MRLQSFVTDPIIHRSFKGNSDTITSCLFNPDMYVKPTHIYINTYIPL